jgi:hypothetical protein
MTSGPATSVAANGERDGYPDVVGTPASFGRDLRRGDGGSTGSAWARSKSARTVIATVQGIW